MSCVCVGESVRGGTRHTRHGASIPSGGGLIPSVHVSMGTRGLMPAARLEKKSLRKSRASCEARGRVGWSWKRVGGPLGSAPPASHLVHVESQGHQRDSEAAFRSPQVGGGGHVQRLDGELGAESRFSGIYGGPAPPQSAPVIPQVSWPEHRHVNVCNRSIPCV